MGFQQSVSQGSGGGTSGSAVMLPSWLRSRRVVLASASPRRREILEGAGLQCRVVPSMFPETLSPRDFPSPAGYAEETARRKALEVASRIHLEDMTVPDLVIGADTIVVLDGLVLGKPLDKEDAFRMLSLLSGRTHSVVTGVAVLWCHSEGGKLRPEARCFHEETRVSLRRLREAELRGYVDTGEPLDKAGGVALQGLGAAFVCAVRGDILAAVGFPLSRFSHEMAALGPRAGAEDEEDNTSTVASLAPELAMAFDLTSYRRLCPVGGGARALASELCLSFPSLELTPHQGSGDVSQHALPEAELYLVLYGPSPAGPGASVLRAAEACRPGAGLMVVEDTIALRRNDSEDKDGDDDPVSGDEVEEEEGRPPVPLLPLLRRLGFHIAREEVSIGPGLSVVLGIRGC